MSDNSLREGLRGVRDSVRAYVDSRLTIWKLELIEHAAKAGTAILTFVLLLVGVAFVLLFLSLAFALWFGSQYESYALGFLLVAAFWCVLLVALYLLRGVLFTSPLVRRLREVFFGKSGGK